MKLYSNPQPEDNGFVIVKTLNEIIQANVSSSNKNLVEICKSIPMNDTKIDKIRNEGTFRIPKTGKTEDIEPPSLKGGNKVFKKDIKHVKKYDIRWT